MAEKGPRGLYRTLGVCTNASSKTIRQAYHQLATKWHPDKWQTEDSVKREAAEAKFMEIKAAYDTLSNEDLRFSYDAANLNRMQPRV